MTQVDYVEAKRSCYQLAMSLGKTGNEQNELIKALKDVEKTYDNYKETIQHMLSVIYDGLAFGNWPWVFKK